MKTVKIYGKFVFYFFVLLQNGKSPWASVSILWSRSQNSVSKFQVFFLILFRLVKLFIVKKRPNGVSFKLFSNSVNMKRLSSTCLLHTRKIIWRVLSPTVGYLFFGSDRLFYEKGTFGVFFCLCSDSLNMNDTEFTFTRLIKLNTDRPFFGIEPLLS